MARRFRQVQGSRVRRPVAIAKNIHCNFKGRPTVKDCLWSPSIRLVVVVTTTRRRGITTTLKLEESVRTAIQFRSPLILSLPHIISCFHFILISSGANLTTGYELLIGHQRPDADSSSSLGDDRSEYRIFSKTTRKPHPVQ